VRRRVVVHWQIPIREGLEGGGTCETGRVATALGWVKRILLGLLLLFIVVQFVPYGRDHPNPAVVAEPVWDSTVTRDLAVRACFDCHSNETVWAWYSHVAPVSWLVQQHVDEGREELNFSEWQVPQDADESAETVREGSMPTRDYAALHPEARLSDDERKALIAGLVATFGEDQDDDDHDEGDDDHEDDHDDD
jgi:hypothetical protein